MENIITKKEYSFKEKFFSFKEEKRIRRWQFFVRLLAIGLLIGIVWEIWEKILYSIFNRDSVIFASILKNILWQILLIFYIISWFYLASKRNNDIGKKVTNLIKFPVLFLIISSIINNIVTYLILFSNISIEIGSVLTIFQIIVILSNILIGVVTIVLIFYPGKKWDNEFWEDPINTKVGFLG